MALPVDQPQRGFLRPRILDSRVSMLMVVLVMAAACWQREQPVSPQEATTPQMHDLATLVRSHPDLARFSRALEVAGIHETLSDIGPITIFAPKNEAFDQARLDTLVSPVHADSVWKIFSHHIVRGRLGADRVGEQLVVSSLSDEPVVLRRDGPEAPLRVDGATVTESLNGTNGVLHVVDRVLTPAVPPEQEQWPISNER
jgi:uncharacterized surface protein with fasciclin (FAS1) repeats